MPVGLLAPKWSPWRRHQSSFNLNIVHRAKEHGTFVREKIGKRFLVRGRHKSEYMCNCLTINMMLDLHGPEKVTCLVRYLLAFGIITMADCEEEHAISQAFTNAYINWEWKKQTLVSAWKTKDCRNFRPWQMAWGKHLCVIMVSISMSSIFAHIEHLWLKRPVSTSGTIDVSICSNAT